MIGWIQIFSTDRIFHYWQKMKSFKKSFSCKGKENNADRAVHVQFQDKQEKLQIEDLQPDHLEAVKLEKDGHLNRDYKKEIFLGNHEEIDEGTDEQRETKLRDIFHR